MSKSSVLRHFSVHASSSWPLFSLVRVYISIGIFVQRWNTLKTLIHYNYYLPGSCKTFLIKLPASVPPFKQTDHWVILSVLQLNASIVAAPLCAVRPKLYLGTKGQSISRVRGATWPSGFAVRFKRKASLNAKGRRRIRISKWLPVLAEHCVIAVGGESKCVRDSFPD